MPSKKKSSTVRLPPTRQSSSPRLLPAARQSSPRSRNIDNIFIQNDIIFSNTNTDTNLINNEDVTLYAEIIKILTDNGGKSANTTEMIEFLGNLSKNDTVDSHLKIFQDIDRIVRLYNKESYNFQTKIHPHTITTTNGVTKNEDLDIFAEYKLWNKENQQNFITIDPTIIQIMIFDSEYDNCITQIAGETVDIVYSLKLIIKDQNKLVLRYTTHLFPEYKNDGGTKKQSKIKNFKDLTDFNNFNKQLYNNPGYNNQYDNELLKFLKQYIKFYKFYKKCYKINDTTSRTEKILTDYQLKYISILGKARFGDSDIKYRTAILTDYIMSNLLFTSPAYGFMSGGYKGFKDNKFGITRSGYEIAKKYNRPILTIMCKEGMHDYHEYSDATLIYGEHWGEDTIALSQFTDGAIVIAPFGGWTYIECLALLKNKKIVGIYNDLYNILNFEDKRNDNIDNDLDINFNKYDNKNFFKFAPSEQNSIIDYYINYYLI